MNINDFKEQFTTEYIKKEIKEQLNIEDFAFENFTFSMLKNIYGDSWTDLKNKSDEFHKKLKTNKKEFYDLKNENFKGSILLSKIYDHDLYRSFFDFVENDKGKFGKNILVIGCENALDAIYLALLFPSSRIIAIDISDKSIKNAHQLADGLALKNIDFKCADIMNFKADKFDTIFSMRVSHEICEYDCKRISNSRRTFHEINLKDYPSYKNYALKINDLLIENGNVIFIERGYLNHLYALVSNLSLCKIYLSDFQRKKLKELKKEESFAFLCFSKNNAINKNLTDFIYPKDYQIFMIQNDVFAGKDTYLLLNQLEESLLYGFDCQIKNGLNIGTCCIYSKKNDATKKIFFLDNGNNQTLAIIDDSQYTFYKNWIDNNFVTPNLRNGFLVIKR